MIAKADRTIYDVRYSYDHWLE